MHQSVETVKVPHISWKRFDRNWIWRQGEHLTVIGSTGQGKTTLINTVLPRREFVLFLSTKKRDSTQDELTGMGFKTAKSVEEIHPDISKRFIVRAPFPKDASVTEIKRAQASIFRRVLMLAFRQGRWTVIADEARYLTDYLGLADEMELLWLQGRSLGVSVVSGTQRPRHIPLEAYSQASHLFFFSNPDMGDVGRIAELASANRQAILDTVPYLRAHEVMYVKVNPMGPMVTTKVKV